MKRKPQVRYRRELKNIIDTSMPAAELGVAEGLFSREILTEWNVSKLYMVDAWRQMNLIGDASSQQEWHDQNFKQVQKIVSEFGERAVILRGITTDMVRFVPNYSLGFLYIDACHKYECVMADLETWLPKLSTTKGIIAGHDYLNPAYGVKDAVTDFCRGRFTVNTIPDIGRDHAGFWFHV